MSTATSKGGIMTRLVMKTASGTFALRIFYLVSGFATTLLLTWWLGAERLGVYNFAISWVVLIVVFSKMGFEDYVTRELALLRSERLHAATRQIFSSVLGLVGGVSVAAGLVFAVVAWFATRDQPALCHPLMASAVLVPVLAVLGLYRGRLRGERLAVRSQIPEFFVRQLVLMSALAAVFMLGIAASATFAVGLNLLATVAALFVSIRFVRHVVSERSSEFESECDRAVEPSTEAAIVIGRTPLQHLYAALPFVLIASLQIVNQRTDRIMLGAFDEMSNVAVYSVGVQIASVVNIAMIAITVIVAPLVAECRVTGATRELQSAIIRASSLATAVAALIVVLLSLIAVPVLEVFGKDFSAAFVPIMVLGGAQLLNVAAGPAGTILAMSGHEKVVGRTIAASAVINVVLNAILIPRYSIIGAAIATTVSIATWNGALVILARRRTGVASNFAALGVPSSVALRDE